MRVIERGANDVSRHDQTRAVLALAGSEARRLARHPLLALGTVVGAIAAVAAWRGANDDVELHGVLAGQAVLPLATATLIAVQLLAARAARDDVAGDTDDAYPMSRARRTAALLLAAMIAPVVSLLIMAPLWIALLGPDLTRSFDGTVWRADLFDLAQPIVLVWAMAWLGVALGMVNTWTPGAVLLALALTWSPLVWVNPMIAIDPVVGDPNRDLLAAIPWQVAFLGGLAGIGGSLAALRSGHRAAGGPLAIAIAFTTLAGIARF